MSLIVEDVELRYGAVRALKGVSLRARTGQATSLLGANGAGKTSLLKAVAGVHPVSRGRIQFDGEDLTGRPAYELARRGICLVPEGRQLFPELTVRENLRMGLHGTSVRGTEAAARIDSACDLFPALQSSMNRQAGLLSGGQQQMVAIARALMRRPRLLLLDEPSLGLAPRLVTEILSTVRTLAAGGVTVLLAEQNAAAALRVADHGLIVQNGIIVRDDAAATLLDDDEVSSHYLGSAVDQSTGPTAQIPTEMPSILRQPLIAK